MATNVYIDGFNLYHGLRRRGKNASWKWLNVDAMCRTLLPGHTINLIRYFTARVIGFQHDVGAPQRQDLYLRALATLPSVRIHSDAFFSSHPLVLPQFPLAYRNSIIPPNRPPLMVQVHRAEEKQTDVDIAVNLIMDCVDQACDTFVVVSNDADLVTPIKTVRDRFGKTIIVINPHGRKRTSGHLITAASSHIRTINMTVVRASQFPDQLTDANGVFSKPLSW